MNKVIGLGLLGGGALALYYFYTQQSSQTPGETAGGTSGNAGGASPANTSAVNPTQDQILAAIRSQSGPLAQFPATQTHDQWNYWAQKAGFAILAFEDSMPADADRNAPISFDRWITSRGVGLHGIGNLRGLYAL